jgi:hypothetical protein
MGIKMTIKLFITDKDPLAYAAYQRQIKWSPDNSDIGLVLGNSFAMVAAFLCGDFESAGAAANRAIIRYMTLPAPSLTAR